MTEPTHKPDIFKSNQCPPLPDHATLLDTVVYWLGIGLGSGLPKTAPGTWGSVGGCLVGVPVMYLGFVPFCVMTLIANVVGVWICGHTSKLMGVHDDPHIVWDEWAGMWIAMLPIAYFYHLPFACDGVCDRVQMTQQLAQQFTQQYGLLITVAAFIAFRFFDIIKPFPIKWADTKVSGGLGIMLDDILAGFMVVIIGVLMFALL